MLLFSKYSRKRCCCSVKNTAGRGGLDLQWSWESAVQIKLVIKRNGLYSLSFYSI